MADTARAETTRGVFRGVGVALLTLFDERGDVDAPATADFAAALCDLGVRAVVVAGTTGEAFTLERPERVALLEAVRARVPADATVIAGTGAPSARQAVVLTRDATAHGADAVLTLSPVGSRDVRPYYEAVVAAAGSVPVLAYHFPGVAPPGIPVSVLPDLGVDGLKDSTGDAGRLLEERTTWDGALYTGSSALLTFAGHLGCEGAILALANLQPELCARALACDGAAQRDLAADHFAVGAGGVATLKKMCAARFGTSPVTRVG